MAAAVVASGQLQTMARGKDRQREIKSGRQTKEAVRAKDGTRDTKVHEL